MQAQSSIDSILGAKDLEFFKKGIELAKKGQHKEAISLFTDAIKITPEGAYYSHRGLSKEKIGDLAGAIIDLNKALEISPEDLLTYFERGCLYSRNKQFVKAIQDFNRVINSGLKTDLVYFERGLAKQRLEDYRGAIEDFNSAIEFDKNQSSYFFNRGFCRIMLGRKDQGCLDLSKAGELGDDKVYQIIKKFCK
jgi:tetratricopeptide (TPR) repeat protein